MLVRGLGLFSLLIMLGGPAMAAPDAELPALETLWDFAQPAKSETAFREALGRARTAGNHDYAVQALTQIARAQVLQQNFDAAHRTLDEAETELGDRDLPLARMRYVLERARAWDSPAHPKPRKQTEKARVLFLESIDYGKRHKLDAYTIDAIHMLGIIEPPDQQIAWNLQAIEMAERSTDAKARKWLGPLLNNTGWSYHDVGQYDKALELFQRGWEHWKTQTDVKATLIAKWTVGRAMRSLGRLAEALALQTSLLEDWKAAGIEESGYASEEIGECLWALGRRAEAREHFALAFARLSAHESWLAQEEPARLERLKRLGAGAAE
ncbi:MAG: hypothetical protein HYV63_18090 [Candidatus Schekmanbacteria bacterium]|nr:hypothetical protein [Candidatus Schekmanbacteria bacterium]